MDLKATTEDTKEVNVKNETCNELKTIKYKSNSIQNAVVAGTMALLGMNQNHQLIYQI